MIQRNFILTDIMKTGQPVYLQNFIDTADLPNQEFTYTEEYYRLHNFDLKSYDRRIAIIDMNFTVNAYLANKNYQNDLASRLKELSELDFYFVYGCPWESKENLETKNWLNSEWTVEGKRSVPYKYYVWTGGVTWFWSYMKYKYLNHNLHIDHTNKKFDMLYLNKFPRKHRTGLYNQIKDNGLLENSLYSFVRLQNPIRLPQEYELPLLGSKDYPWIGLDQDLYEKPYNETKFSLISETNDANGEVFITEKLWKAIICKHVFVVHGNLNYLKTIKDLGFRTFDSLFDESYDSETDKNKRISKIVETCKSLIKKDWQELYQESKDIREHNYKLFFDNNKLRTEINKELSLWLKFVDNSKISS